ncbi:hypothetical protein [Acetobacterium wieringae]|nr:hypothetical protein [Acetobacterium wieringae]
MDRSIFMEKLTRARENGGFELYAYSKPGIGLGKMMVKRAVE